MVELVGDFLVASYGILDYNSNSFNGNFYFSNPARNHAPRIPNRVGMLVTQYKTPHTHCYTYTVKLAAESNLFQIQ